MLDKSLLHRMDDSYLYATLADGPAISKWSRWNDLKWYYGSETSGHPPSLASFSFDFNLLEETEEFEPEFLHGPKYKKLADEIRRYVHSLRTERRNAKPMSINSLRSHSPYVQFFAQWLVSTGCFSLGDLDPQLVTTSFKDYVKRRVLIEDPYGDDDGLTEDAILQFLEVPLMLHEQNYSMPPGVSLIRENPYPNETPRMIAKQLARRITVETPAIPTPLYNSIMLECFSWLEIKIPDIIEIQETYLRTDRTFGPRAYKARRGIKPRWTALKRAFSKHSFSSLPGRNDPWHRPLVPKISKRPAKRGSQKKSFDGIGFTVRRLIEEAISACVLAIIGLSGMRIGETCSLEAEPFNSTTGFPACVEIEDTLNGRFEALYLARIIRRGWRT